MRLSKNSARILAASLCLAVAVSMTGCSESSAPPSAQPSNSSSGSQEAPSKPSGEDNGNSSSSSNENSSSSDESSKDNQDEIIELSDSSTWMKPHLEGYCYRFSADEFGKISGLTIVYCGESLPSNNKQYVYLSGFPADYAQSNSGYITNYIWLENHLYKYKNKPSTNPIPLENWEYRAGYKFVCELGLSNVILPYDCTSFMDPKDYDSKNPDRSIVSGWCKEENVKDVLASQTKDFFVVLNGDPFPKKSDGRRDIYYFFYWNGDVYRH